MEGPGPLFNPPPPLLKPFKRGVGPDKYPRDIRCIMGMIVKGTSYYSKGNTIFPKIYT